MRRPRNAHGGYAITDDASFVSRAVGRRAVNDVGRMGASHDVPYPYPFSGCGVTEWRGIDQPNVDVAAARFIFAGNCQQIVARA